MTIERSSTWDLDPPVESEHDIVLCSECKAYSPLAEWGETDVPCEACGSHSAMKCPQCGYAFDHVFATLGTKRRGA